MELLEKTFDCFFKEKFKLFYLDYSLIMPA